MRNAVILFFILCLTTLEGRTAPNDDTVVDPDPQSTSKTSVNNNNEDPLKSLDVTVPEKKNNNKNLVSSENSEGFYYPYRQAVSPRLGLVLDPEELRNDFKLVFLFGVTYLLPSDIGKHWEVGFDAHTGGTGYVQLGKRFIYQKSEKFRPFFRPGIAIKLKSQEGVASLVNIRNVQLRLAAGFEDLIRSPLSIAVAVELGANADSGFLVLAFGYSWAW